MTPFSDTFVGAKINNVYMSKTTPGTPVMVNATVQLTENAEHLRSSVKQDVQKQLTGALQRRNNNVGTSGLWVDSPAGAISQLHGNVYVPCINDLTKSPFLNNICRSYYVLSENFEILSVIPNSAIRFPNV